MRAVPSPARAEAVHFNYAGAGVPSPEVLDRMRHYLELETSLGPYEAEAAHGEAVVAATRAALAGLLGAEPSGVALFDNATRAWTTLVGNLPLRAGDEVWVSAYDYVGNLFHLAELRRRLGLRIVVMPCTPRGDVDLDWIAAHLTDDVALVSVSHLPSCCGVVVDVAAIGALLRGSRALFVVDGCQAVGNVEVDVTAIGADIYTGAGRKFLRGPRGTGFAHVSDRYLALAAPAVLDVHAMTVSPALDAKPLVEDATSLELAERNIAVWAGLGVAVAEDQARDATERRQTAELFADLERQVCALPGLRRLGEASRRSGTVSVCSDRRPVTELYARLRERGIRTWVGHGAHTPLFAPGQGADEFLRISMGRGTTTAEVDLLVHALTDLTE
ncbi:aminotransferase class V-fold PLP-dependent enzyme [Micromonospora sp. R77]|uniref:aminotransferase class V-fold PLP-dependent enzyme n=1 Tax=Micromonospora sp. R77 TaxID=2925836 RepID=UPI001F614023|nr:aminotransferase class V-fold PLP-dependent enzyme [Micromonospora sp. R77]MCI4066890.1 aminotransferase class V-fold PLP-dependent enzyme [Micromonospora sp. R77]